MKTYDDILRMLNFFSELRHSEGMQGSSIGYTRAISQIEYQKENGVDIDRFISLVSQNSVKYVGSSIREKILNLWYGMPIEGYEYEVNTDFGTNNPHKHYQTRESAYNTVKPILKLIDKLNLEYELAGSYRRNLLMVGDIDIMVNCENLEDLAKEIRTLNNHNIEFLAEGQKKLKLNIDLKLEVDIRSYKDESKGAMLFYFTGSAKLCRAFRTFYQKAGMSLNEYGVTFYRDKILTSRYPDKILRLFKQKSEDTIFLPIKSEEVIFKLIGMKYIEPNNRN